jgi:16S rRNA (guanine966-N2)-methyltransferase
MEQEKMRIIAGKFRGKRLLTPKDSAIRPTTDRLRESIFNALIHRLGGFEGVRVADIFAGTGAFGIEALSRGATFACFVEKHRQSLDLIRQNVDRFGIGGQAEVLTADARNLPEADKPYDVIFMDPPYGQGLAGPTLESLITSKWIAPVGLIVVEREEKDALDTPLGFEELKCIRQGKRRADILTPV